MKTDSHPYREDPTKLLREAHELSRTAHERLNAGQSRFDELDKRITSLENNRKAQHGFFRTNWDKFWYTVGEVFFPLSCIVAVGLALAFLVYSIGESKKEDKERATQACQAAGMELVYTDGYQRVTCVGPDRTVLILRDGSATVVMPTIELTTDTE